MSDALPLPAALPAVAAAAPSAPGAVKVTVVSADTAAAADAAGPVNPIEVLSNVTDADSLFGALMTIANAPVATLKGAAVPKAKDDDVAVATDPLAAALLALPVLENRDAHVIQLNGDAPLLISADGRPAAQPADPRSVPDLAKSVCVPVSDVGVSESAPATDKPRLELSIQILPTLPATPADPAPHRVQAAATSVADATGPIALPQIQLPATAAANAVPPQAPAITVPPSHPQWAEQVAASVVWCVKEKLTEAEVRLHPPELGPLHVTLRLDHDAVDVRIVAANPATRDALEQTLPQLRDLFQQQGLSLVQAQVGDSSANMRDRMPQLQPVAPVASEASGDAPVSTATVHLRRSGLLDEYA